MLTAKAAFSGFSVDNSKKAKEFYTNILGLALENEEMGLTFHLPGGTGSLFIYAKDDHQPATYTVLNLVVDNIDNAVDELVNHGVKFERYENMTDDKGVARGIAAKRGPDIAWFKDPAGNTLSILQER